MFGVRAEQERAREVGASIHVDIHTRERGREGKRGAKHLKGYTESGCTIR